MDLKIGIKIEVVEDNSGDCKGCFFYIKKQCNTDMYCSSDYRKDGKNVKFKLIT